MGMRDNHWLPPLPLPPLFPMTLALSLSDCRAQVLTQAQSQSQLCGRHSNANNDDDDDIIALHWSVYSFQSQSSLFLLPPPLPSSAQVLLGHFLFVSRSCHTFLDSVVVATVSRTVVYTVFRTSCSLAAARSDNRILLFAATSNISETFYFFLAF